MFNVFSRLRKLEEENKKLRDDLASLERSLYFEVPKFKGNRFHLPLFHQVNIDIFYMKIPVKNVVKQLMDKQGYVLEYEEGTPEKVRLASKGD